MGAADRCDFDINLEESDLNLRERYHRRQSSPKFRCHREVAPESNYCFFHQTASRRDDDVDIESVFLQYLQGETIDRQGIAAADSFEFRNNRERRLRRQNFIGVHFDDLDFPFETLADDNTAPLDLRDAKIGKVNLESARVRTEVDFSHANVDEIILDSASIGGRFKAKGLEVEKLEFRDAKIEGNVVLDEVQTSGKIGFRNASLAADLRLHGAEIGKHLSLTKTTVDGQIIIKNTDLNYLAASNGDFGAGFEISGEFQITKHISLKKATIEAGLNISGETETTVGNYLLLAGATVNDGATLKDLEIGGELSFENAFVTEQTTLDNLHVETIKFDESRWTDSLSISDCMICDGLQGSKAIFEDTVDATELTIGIERFGDRDGIPKLVEFDEAVFETSLQLGFDQIEPEEAEEYLMEFERVSIAGGTLPQSADGVRLFYNLFDSNLGDVRLEPDDTPRRLFDHFFLHHTTFDGFDFTARPHREALRESWILHDFPDRCLKEVDTKIQTEETEFHGETYRAMLLSRIIGSPKKDLDVLSSLETTYLRARQGADAIGDTIAASKFFLIERELIKKYQYRTFIEHMNSDSRAEMIESSSREDAFPQEHRHPGVRWIANSLLERTCGYGELPLRPIKFSLSIVGWYALLYFLVGAFNQPSLGSLLSSGRLLSVDVLKIAITQISFSFQTFVTLIFGTASAEEAGLFTRFAAATEGFVGAFAIALFVFTFTRSLYR